MRLGAAVGIFLLLMTPAAYAQEGEAPDASPTPEETQTQEAQGAGASDSVQDTTSDEGEETPTAPDNATTEPSPPQAPSRENVTELLPINVTVNENQNSTETSASSETGASPADDPDGSTEAGDEPSRTENGARISVSSLLALVPSLPSINGPTVSGVGWPGGSGGGSGGSSAPGVGLPSFETPAITVPVLPSGSRSLYAGPGPGPAGGATTGDTKIGPASSTIVTENPTDMPLSAVAVLAATTLLISAGTGTSFAGAVAGTKKLLARILPTGVLALFTRLAPDALLDHPRRNEIAELVRQNPGERLEVVRKVLGLANGPMLHHIRVLEHGHVLRVVRDGGMARLYPAGPRVQPTPYVLPVRRRLLEELRARPGVTQRQVAQATGLSERVVSHHMGWLRSNGFVEVRRNGAAKQCFPAPVGQSSV